MARLFSDITHKKLHRFRSIRRGYYAFCLFMLMVLLALTAELWASNRALLVKYEGQLYFPTYGAEITGDTFGLGYQYETNYRELKSVLATQAGNWVLLPPVPWSPYEQDYSSGSFPPNAPSLEQGHYLGTDSSGRDILARLVYGFRTAVGFAFIALTASYAIGVLLGCLMGFVGGRFDLLFQRFIEIWSQVPFLYVIMILVSLTQPNFMLFVGINVLFGWMGITWYMRTLTYREKVRDYVLAARAQRDFPAQALLAYGATITSFLGAIHWGLAMRSPAGEAVARDYLWGVVPSLVAWAALLAGAGAGLAILVVLLWTSYGVDRSRYPAWGQQHWLPMRLRLTLVASLSCLVAAASIGFA